MLINNDSTESLIGYFPQNFLKVAPLSSDVNRIVS